MTSNERALATYGVYAKFRNENGVNDYQVAKNVGLRPACICDWKHGRYTPKIEKLIRIADFLGFPVLLFYQEGGE